VRVLIADDEFYIRYMTRRLISWQDEGFLFIDEAANSLEAMQLIEQHKPDVALLDIRMPGLSGLELAEKACAVSPHTMMIIISGYADFAYAQAALRNPHIVDYLLKPLQENELLRAIQQCKQRLEKLRAEQDSADEHQLHKQIISQTREDDWQQALLDEIRSGVTEDLPLNQLSKKYHVSISRLSTLIKQKLGMNYTAYVNARRLELAAHLLTSTSIPVSEISARVGYKDTLYFTRLFKQAYGMPPGGYRKQKGS